MKIPCQKIIKCHKCGYTVFSRATFVRRNLNKRPYFCGQCGSKDFIEVLAKGYHLVICRKAEDIEQAIKILNKIDSIPNIFLKAFDNDRAN